MAREVTIPVTFQITDEPAGPLDFQVEWVSGEQDGFRASLTCGAGVGSSSIKADGHLDGRKVYALGNIRDLANRLFAELEQELRG